MPSGMRAEKLPLDLAQPVASLGPDDELGARATAVVFRTLGHPLRLQIVSYLHRHGPTRRDQLTEDLRQRWTAMEYHLKGMTADGLLTARGLGIKCVYDLNGDLLGRLRALCEDGQA